MKSFIIALLTFILHISLANVSHAQTLADELTSFAQERNLVLVIDSPFLIRNNADLATKCNIKFSSEPEMLSYMRKCGYSGVKTGRIITLQFNGLEDNTGLFLFSLREYADMFSHLSKILRTFDKYVPRTSKYSEDLVDSFSESEKKMLSSGIRVSDFSPLQYVQLNNWIFGLNFSKAKDTIYGADMLSHAIASDFKEMAINVNAGIINITYVDNGKQRVFQLGSDIVGADTSNFQLYQGKIEPVTLSSLVQKIGQTDGVSVSLDDSIKDREFIVIGKLEETGAESALTALVHLAKWRLVTENAQKSFSIRLPIVPNPKNISEIDMLCRRVVQEYPILALYGSNYVKQPQLIATERAKNQATGKNNERDFEERKNYTVESGAQFKAFVFKNLVSRLNAYSKNKKHLVMSDLSDTDKRLILGLFAIDIYRMIWLDDELAEPEWMSHLQDAVLSASFRNDGKYNRVSVEIALPNNGERYVPLSAVDTLYHFEFNP